MILAAIDQESRDVLDALVTVADRVQSKLTSFSLTLDQFWAKGSRFALAVRMVRLVRVFRVTAEGGYAHEAEMILRPFLEVFVDWLYIGTNPDDLGERYLSYGDAAHLQHLRDHGLVAEETKFLAAHGDKVQEFCARYGKGGGKLPRDWSGESIGCRAEKGGLTNYHGRVYRHLCHLIHNDPAALPRYVQMPPGGVLGGQWGPDDAAQLHRPIALAALTFLAWAKEANDHLDLDIEALLDEVGPKAMAYAGLG